MCIEHSLAVLTTTSHDDYYYYYYIIIIIIILGRHGGLMISVLVPWVSGPGLSPGWGHCVVFLGKTLNSHSAFLHPPNKLRGNDLWWTSILSRGSRNTPSRFMLQKPLWQLWSTRIERLHFFFIIIIIIIISITSKFRDIGGLAHFLLSLVAIRSISALIWDSFIPPILFILQHTEMTIFIWADAREGKKKITKTMRQILTSTPCKYSLRTVS